MERINTVKMLISRYKADAANLAQREHVLERDIEIIENLINTVTICYISKMIQTKEMPYLEVETEKVREKLVHLKKLLRELQLSVKIVVEEGIVIRKRIEELELLLEFQYTFPNVHKDTFMEPNFLNHDTHDSMLQKEVEAFKEGPLGGRTPESMEPLQAKVGRRSSEALQNQVIRKPIPTESVKDESIRVLGKTVSYDVEEKKEIDSSDENKLGTPNNQEVNKVKTGLVKDIKQKFESFSQGVDINLKKSDKRSEPVSHVLGKHFNDRPTSQESKESDSPIKDVDGIEKLSQGVDIKTNTSDKRSLEPVAHSVLRISFNNTSQEAKEDVNQVKNVHEFEILPEGVEFDVKTSNKGSEPVAQTLQRKSGINTGTGTSREAKEDVNVKNVHEFEILPEGVEFDVKTSNKGSDPLAQMLQRKSVINTLKETKEGNSEDKGANELEILSQGFDSSEKSSSKRSEPGAQMLQRKSVINASNESKEGNSEVTGAYELGILSQGFDISEKSSSKGTQPISQMVFGTSLNATPRGSKGSDNQANIDKTNEIYKSEKYKLTDGPSNAPDNQAKGSQFVIEMSAFPEDTDWKYMSEQLLNQVSELRTNLQNSTLKLKESGDYIRQLEEKCLRLEKELQEKNTMIKSKAMLESLAKATRQAMQPNSYFMVEGEGVTPAYMQLAHWRFALKLSEYQGDKDLKDKLMNGIKQGNMAPYYKEVCADLGWNFDSKLFDEMSAANVKRLEELEKEHENNVMDEEDQSQLCGVWQSKLDYLCSIGDRENATALANSKVDDKTVPKSHRIDAVFSLFRISFFHGCNIKGMSTAIEKATELIEGISGGDWSARNKLKAYEGVWSLAIRDFTRAAHLFVDVVPTFESYELADFGTIIRYTVLSCMIALPRCDLRKKLMLHGVMAQALHSQYQDLREYFVSLYDGRYSDFLVCLARIEVEMKRDPLLHPHYRHYVQEMRLRAYKQILQAYRSLSLDYMAQSFGVTSEFIEREVARFAAAGRLQCKIDSVAGTVITSAHLDDSVRSKEAPEASLDRNILYQTTVKRGDILLNRLKKLARVMDF